MAMTLRLGQDLKDRLRERAQRERLSMHKVVERMLDAHLDDDLAETHIEMSGTGPPGDATVQAIARLLGSVRFNKTLP